MARTNAKAADPLATYNRKRDFAKTAEPAGKAGKKRAKDEGEDPKPILTYTGLNTFTATYRAEGKGAMVWTLGREKLFFWKLKKIEVSEVVLDGLTDEAERTGR